MRFKTKKIESDFVKVHVRLQQILLDMDHFCEENDYEFVITSLLSTKEEDEKLKRVSPSHREGRAADVSVKGWDENFIKEFKTYFGIRYREDAAISATSGKPALIVDHVGTARHLHVQIKRGINV